MSTLTGLIGGGGQPVPTSLPVNTVSTWGSLMSSARLVTSGTSLDTIVNITSGSGFLYGIWGTSTSTNTYRSRIVIDGVVVMDKSSTTVGGDYFIPFPFQLRGVGDTRPVGGAPLRFESSLLVQHASAVGVTVTSNVQYYLT